MTEHVRPAAATDVDAMTEMASARRRQYAGYQPAFWRPAANAGQLHRRYLARLIENQDVITLVSEDSGLFTGFLVATIGDAPGVYDPGGRTCQIDDFAVTPDRWATAGPLLLRSAIEQAARRGAVQAVVVTGHLDQPKRDALRSCGLSVASEWWVSSWPRKSLLARQQHGWAGLAWRDWLTCGAGESSRFAMSFAATGVSSSGRP